MNILDKIVEYKKEELIIRKMMVPVDELMRSTFMNRACTSLKKSLEDSPMGIIAEFKRKSPSKGFINADADVQEVTELYTRFGASGLSVLTDNHFFGGSTEDLVIARTNDIPLLRKEFIIDTYQVLASKAMGADVILLIAACLSVEDVARLAAAARLLGMEVLLEIHEESELGHICADVDMVGVNNRNLKTFAVDLQNSIRLSKLIPSDKLKISESGIDSKEAITMLRGHGFRGFLMGEVFMKEKDPGNAFGKFMEQLKN